MSLKPLVALLCVLFIVSGCAELDALMYPAKQDADTATTGKAAGADQVYINPAAPAGVAALRNIYIAPANLANMQVIQPEGASADAEWWVTDEEAVILQQAIAYEFSVALGFQAAFNVVSGPEQADIVVNTAVVAVHPSETRASRAREASTGGAITVSMAMVQATSGVVLLRSVDTRASDNIWAFNQVQKDDPALNLVFRDLGDTLRRGLLQLQGRPDAARARTP